MHFSAVLMCSCYSSVLSPVPSKCHCLDRWKMNGTEIKIVPDSRYRLNGGNLVITNPVKAKDAGYYQCVAANTVGTVVSREALVRFGCKLLFQS